MIIIQGLGWRKKRAAFYRNCSSSFCFPRGCSPKKAGSSQLAGERGRGGGSGCDGPGSTLAPAGHVLTGAASRLPTLCQGPGHPRLPGRTPAKINKSLCFSFRHCIITANMHWRRTAIVRQLLKALRCAWRSVLESQARNPSSSWLGRRSTRDFQKSGVVSWHGNRGMSLTSHFLDSGFLFTTKPTD